MDGVSRLVVSWDPFLFSFVFRVLYDMNVFFRAEWAVASRGARGGCINSGARSSQFSNHALRCSQSFRARQ